MNLHEYQAKALLKKYGANVPNGQVAFSAEEAKDITQKSTANIQVVKAQIHAGGRGKAGGVKLTKSPEETYTEAKNMLGKKLITHQTGPEGQTVGRVYIEEGSNIESEYYLSLILDRDTSSIVFIASTEGGMDIEEVAAETPEKIIQISINPITGLSDFHIRNLANVFGFQEKSLFVQFAKNVKAFYQAFVELDCMQLEINPLIKTKEGDIIALDCKINIDDNALYRQPQLLELRDEAEEDPLELRASKQGLAYIKMEGTIGCMVNGAGLAMSTMDIIKQNNEAPANFLDVGGSATKERVIEAFKIIMSDPNVKAILINIFGGIMKCDIIAEGVISAVKETGLSVPLVVRLEGTNVEKGKEILEKSDLLIIAANDLGDAAKKVVASIN